MPRGQLSGRSRRRVRGLEDMIDELRNTPELGRVRVRNTYGKTSRGKQGHMVISHWSEDTLYFEVYGDNNRAAMESTPPPGKLQEAATYLRDTYGATVKEPSR